MPAVRRKSAMRVRDGRVQRKNNWVPDHRDYYARPQAEIQIERDDPGRGYRHVVTVPQLRAFIELLPDWDELGVGLEAIAITSGNPSWWGVSNPGVVVITAFPRELWWYGTTRSYLDDSGELLDWLEVEIVEVGDGLDVHWTEPQARAWMLLDVLLHELGHHHDRMTTRGIDAPGGEPFAIAYAQRAQREIFTRYVDRFGI